MLDAYNRKARLTPAVLAVLPSVLFLLATAIRPTLEASVSVGLLAALALLICALVRDRGRSIEPKLWEEWGGPPTSVRLRWGSQSNDAEIRSLHQRVSAATNIPLPDADLQANGPVEAERIYEQAVMILRERTRESSAFPLVAAENAEYGFRRNLLGLRPLALSDAGVTLFAAVALLADGHARFAVPAFASAVAIVLWLRLITPRWVRLAAERYADRLLGAAVALPSAETS